MSVPATLIASIINGEYDDDLERLSITIRERQRDIKARQGTINKLTLTPGTRVRLTGRLSPKYLIGATGVVAERSRGQRIAVTLDRPVGRFGAYGPLQVPANCVEAV